MKAEEVETVNKKYIELEKELLDLRTRYHMRDAMVEDLESKTNLMEQNRDELTKRTRIAERVRDELAEKLDFEAKTIHSLCRLYDLACMYIGNDEVAVLQKLFARLHIDSDSGAGQFGSHTINSVTSTANGGRGEDDLLMESIKIMVSRYTGGQVWKQNKRVIYNELAKQIPAMQKKKLWSQKVK